MGVAPAHLDADRADPAVLAGARQRARVGAAAAGHQPAGRAAVLRRSPVARALAGQVLPVQCLRRALVRSHLPAAVPLARRVRDPAYVPPGRLRPPAAAPGAAEPVPAAAGTPHGVAARRGRGARRERGAAGRQAVPGAHRGWLGVGGEGVPARGRQPAVPPRAARPARGGRPGRAVRLQGGPAACRRPVLRQHGDRARPVPARAAGVRRRPAAVHDRAAQVHRELRPVRDRYRAAVGLPRLPQLHHAAWGPGPALRPPGEQPAERGRREGLPHRPRVRTGVPGHRRGGPGGVQPAGAVHPGVRGRALLRRCDQGPRRSSAAAGVRRGVPAHHRRLRREAGVGLPGALPAAGEPGLLRAEATWA